MEEELGTFCYLASANNIQTSGLPGVVHTTQGESTGVQEESIFTIIKLMAILKVVFISYPSHPFVMYVL